MEDWQKENRLNGVRDLLLPGLRSSGGHNGYTGDLYVDYLRGRIIVELYPLVNFRKDDDKVTNTVVVRRIIPPEDIADRSYIAKFNPLLLDMMAECEREEARCLRQ